MPGSGKGLSQLVIDSFIVGFVNNIVGFMLGYSLALAGVSLNVIWVAGLIVGVVLSLAYYAGMVSSSKQATLGKLAMGIKVVDLNGRRIGFGRACGRELGKILSGLIFLVGYIMAATTERKQAASRYYRRYARRQDAMTSRGREVANWDSQDPPVV